MNMVGVTLFNGWDACFLVCVLGPIYQQWRGPHQPSAPSTSLSLLEAPVFTMNTLPAGPGPGLLLPEVQGALTRARAEVLPDLSHCETGRVVRTQDLRRNMIVKRNEDYSIMLGKPRDIVEGE